ncbi:major facilitator superfamily domain-containing protein [Peziza echinospora]|nr:major facilitator superfamily domain-containing protein [Peziza echinospora]
MDGYDFHSVSLSLSRLAEYYDKPRESIATSITLTLLFRPIGAVLFGFAGDMYGRKWPMIANLILISGLQLATAYCYTFKSFLIVRAMFGIGMGGIWGNAASMGLENMPVDCRGVFSGILQQGYALGYLIAALMNLYVVPKVEMTFRALFYIGAALTFLVAFARLFFPESQQFLEKKAAAALLPPTTAMQKVQAFKSQVQKMLKKYWRRCLYATFLLGIFNAMSHTSQDLYPTYMQQTKLFSPESSSLATIIAKCGALLGGTFAGYYSQAFGRRATIMIASFFGAIFIPLWVLPSSWGALVAGAFVIQFCVQGAWGIIPIHLNELAPRGFRASFPGITYQLGNMLASPMAQIASVVSENWKIWVTVDGEREERPDYGRTQAVMMAVIFTLTIIWTAAGPEKRGVEFEEPEVGEGEKGEILPTFSCSSDASSGDGASSGDHGAVVLDGKEVAVPMMDDLKREIGPGGALELENISRKLP